MMIIKSSLKINFFQIYCILSKRRKDYVKAEN
jgi:hypothetical protein